MTTCEDLVEMHFGKTGAKALRQEDSREVIMAEEREQGRV